MIKIVNICILISLIGLMFLLLYPRSYDVLPFVPRVDTHYWQLTTGSKIGYFKMDGIGEVENTPILYLHGGPGGQVTDQTIDMLRPLSELGYDVYLYDQVGSGHSNRLTVITEYSVARHNQDLSEIIEILGSDQVILMGQSWGALLAMVYVEDHPDKVYKMIFTGPGPILPIDPSLAALSSPDSLHLKDPKFSNQQGNAEAYNLRAKAIRFMANKFGMKIASDAEADDFFTFLNTELSRSTKCDGSDVEKRSGGAGYYSHLMTFKSFAYIQDKKSNLKDLQIPTLLIKGQCDNQKWGYTNEYLNLLPNSKLYIIDDAGHIIEPRFKEEYVAVMKAFLDGE